MTRWMVVVVMKMGDVVVMMIVGVVIVVMVVCKEMKRQTLDWN